MCIEAGKLLPPAVSKDAHDRSGHTVDTTNSEDDFPHADETFDASRITDSIAVQKRHGPNDCEEHEENPHLEDFLVKRLDEVDEDDAALTAAITETDTEESASEQADATDAGTTSTDAATATAAPTKRRSCLRPETASYYDRPKTEKSKRKIHFGEINVRDYGMTLGDNPSVSYGPPVTLDWDYEEYNAVAVDEYEFHRPPRRCLREMGLNYYQRKHILNLAGHTEEEFKEVKKIVKKWKTNRYLTRAMVSSAIPFAKMEDVFESALRKCKRIVKDDHWKSERHLFVQC